MSDHDPRPEGEPKSEAAPPPPPMPPPHGYVFGEEADTRAEVEAEAVDEATTSRSEALVAILIVVATLAAAVIGYLQVWSSSRSDAAATVAQRTAIEATSRQVRQKQWADAQVSVHIRSALARQQADLRSSQGQLLGQALTPEEVLEGDRLREQADRFADLSRLLGRELTGIQIEGPLSDRDDPAFPTRFVNETTREPTRLQALQDAANDESSQWSAKAATYTAVLTLFAVCLYLLGFSLALPQQLGKWFVRGGAAFLAVGVAWAAIASTGRPEAPSEEAAAAFADGTVSLASASDAYDASGYVDAVKDFDRAIAARPDFARAYLNRSQATYFASSPTSGLGTVTSPEALRSAIADLKRAVDLGLDNALALGDIGALSFQQAMVDDRDDLLRQGLDFTQQVIAIDPDRPLWLFNLAVGQLALGRQDEAMRSYQRAIDAAAKEPATQGFWATGAMSALDVLASHRPNLADQAREAKEFVVRKVYGAASNAPEPPSDLPLDLVVSPSLVQFAIPAAQAGDIDPQRDTVVVQWYYDDPAHHGFASLPEISGPVGLFVAADGGWFNLLPYLPSPAPPRCLPSGTYKAEVYVNGHLAGEQEIPEDFGSIRTVTDTGLNAGFCVPNAWIQNPVSTEGVTQAWTAEDGSEGIAVIRATAPGQQTNINVPKVLDIAVRKFAEPFLPPITRVGPEEHFFFMGLTRQLELTYRYKGGFIHAGAGFDPGEAAIVVGIAFGPNARIEPVDRVFTSLSSLQQVPAG
jgi:tetratricopeptide (TPR) repeat protein